jgi:hypothetical protein
MSLGTALLRPQALTDPPVAPRVDAIDAARDLVVGLARDLASGGAGWAIVERELTAGVEQLRGLIEPNVDAAAVHVSDLIDPVVRAVSDSIGGAAGALTPETIASAGTGLIRTTANVLQALQPAQLSGFLGNVFDILEDDLGLSQDNVTSCFSGTLDRIVTGLQRDMVAGASDPAAADRYALGAAIDEVRATASEGSPLPTLSKDTVVPAIVHAMESSGLSATLADFGTRLGRIADALEPLGSLESLAQTLAQAADPHGVQPQDVRPPVPGLPVGLPKASNDTFWYATWYSGHVVTGTGDPGAASELAGVKFGGTFDAATMEAIAHHSRWVAALLEGSMHALSFERGDVASNLLNLLWRLTEGGLAGFADYEMPASIRWILGSGLTVAGGLEGGRWNDSFGLTLMLADVGEAQLYARWVWLLREGLLSALTLANGNPDRIEGLAHVCGELGSFLFPAILAVSDPGNYGIPDGGGSWPRVILYALLLAPVITLAFTFIGGAVFGRILSGSVDPRKVARLALKERMFGGVHGGSAGNVAIGIWTLIASIVSYPLDFSTYWFLLNESKTDGGHLSGRDSSNNEIKAAGYPSDFAHSPYKLPWAHGRTVQCPQGNHGLWSHTPFSNRCELYAYDFGLDHGTEALAMRSGTVWDFREGADDGDPDHGANKIIILHDAPPAAGNGFDFDQNGATTQTFAEYLHGRKDGITNAFRGPAISFTGAESTDVITAANHGFTDGTAVVVIDPGSGSALPTGLTTGTTAFVRDATTDSLKLAATFGGLAIDLTTDGAGFLQRTPLTKEMNSPGSGTRVVQGQLIMFTDDTGRSAYNHLHVQVRPMDAGMTGPDDYTIPFVFSDDDVQGDDGVPRSMNWYDSSNTKAP